MTIKIPWAKSIWAQKLARRDKTKYDKLLNPTSLREGERWRFISKDPSPNDMMPFEWNRTRLGPKWTIRDIINGISVWNPGRNVVNNDVNQAFKGEMWSTRMLVKAPKMDWFDNQNISKVDNIIPSGEDVTNGIRAWTSWKCGWRGCQSGP